MENINIYQSMDLADGRLRPGPNTKYVLWLSEHNKTTCEACLKRDGNVYLLEDEPERPHPNCKCRKLYFDEKPKEGADRASDEDKRGLLWLLLWILHEFGDENQTYIEKFLTGNIFGGILNLLGVTLSSAQSIYLNLCNLIVALSVGEKPKFIYDMNYHDYLNEHKNRFGTSILDSIDVLKTKGAAGAVIASLLETVLELASDPLFLFSILKGIPSTAPESAIKNARVSPKTIEGTESKAPKTTAESVNAKLDAYLLEPTHPTGGSKANWFKQALGFDKKNASILAEQIKFDPKAAVQTAITEFGTKFSQIISIKGINGRVIDVEFVWIRNNDGIVRLVTSIPTKQ